MIYTQIEIHNLLTYGERVTLECKRAKNAVSNSVWETYSAFANTHDGTILLGVEESMAEKDANKRFTFTGVEDAFKVRADFWNMLNNSEKVSINLPKDEYVQRKEEVRMMMRDANNNGNDRLFLEYYTMDNVDIP